MMNIYFRTFTCLFLLTISLLVQPSTADFGGQCDCQINTDARLCSELVDFEAGRCNPRICAPTQLCTGPTTISLNGTWCDISNPELATYVPVNGSVGLSLEELESIAPYACGLTSYVAEVASVAEFRQRTSASTFSCNNCYKDLWAGNYGLCNGESVCAPCSSFTPQRSLTLEQCKEACRQEPGCRFFTYYGGPCNLFLEETCSPSSVTSSGENWEYQARRGS